MNRLDHLFLDLDGTLVDPKPGITACIRFALSELGLPEPETDDLEWCIGPPLQDSFAKLLPDERLVAQAVDLYRQRYRETGIFEQDLYPGVRAMLARCRDAGVSLHLATSKPLVFARLIVDEFGLAASLENVFGSELDGRRGDKRELLTYAIEQTGADADVSAMLGDRKYDMDGARHIGMAGWGAVWGYGGEQELLAAGASELWASPEQVMSAKTSLELWITAG